MSKHEISNSDDVIDSRDVIARIEELEQELEAEYGKYCEEEQKETDAIILSKDEWLKTGEFDDNELTALQALQEEAEGYAPDWKHGATLVRDTYWTEYVQDLLDDIGVLPKDLPGYIVIDWEKTAENIQEDYTSVEFDGVTYWVR